MTIPVTGKQVSVFVFVNGLVGAILTASGAITAYADTLGAGRWASVVLGGLGIIQMLFANYIHETTSSSGPIYH